MPAILLIRHAQASFGGPAYDVLSELGHRQVEALDAALARRGLEPARVVSGPGRRHRDTAAAYGAAVVVDERWDEYRTEEVMAHHGEAAAGLEGEEATITSREFQGLLDAALGKWLAAGEESPAAESWPAFLARVRAGFDELAAGLGRGETAAVFTSAGVIAAVTASLLGPPETVFVPLNRVQVNAGITKVTVGSRTSLISFNEQGHLEDADPALLTYR